MKLYLKVMGVVHVILAFLKLLLLLKCSEGGGCSGYWYSSEGSASTHDRNAKNKSSTYTYMQTKAKAKKQYNNT